MSMALRQVAAQKEVVAEQSERIKDLEAGTRQLGERCAELKEASAGHDERACAAAAEVLKGNRIIEKFMVSMHGCSALGCPTREPPWKPFAPSLTPTPA